MISFNADAVLLNASQLKNKFLGKNVRFSDANAYVTKGGYVRKYKPDYKSFKTSGCPTTFINDPDAMKIQINELSIGTKIIIRDVQLIIGKDMMDNTHCGKENLNIIVNHHDSLTETDVGCFLQNTALPIIDANNKYYSYESCKQMAFDNGKQYFGIANSDSKGYGNCVLASENTYQNAVKYNADRRIKTFSKAISDPTLKVVSIKINVNGNIELYDNGPNLIGTIGSLISNNGICGDNNGSIHNLTATFGKSCLTNANSDKIFDGNVTNIINDIALADSSTNHSIKIHPKNNFTDLAPGCKKDFLLEYQCGGDPTKKIQKLNKNAWNSNIAVSCRSTFLLCNNYLKINDNGTVTINRMSSNVPANNDRVLATIFKLENSEINLSVANNNLTIQENILLNGQQLTAGNYIVSKNKKFKLNIVGDVLTFEWHKYEQLCSKKTLGKCGNENSVFLYKNSEPPDTVNMNKMAYIDGKGDLHSYPKKMVNFSNNYSKYKNYDTGTYDNTSNKYDTSKTNLLATKVQNEASCKTECDNKADCHGFRFKHNANTGENNCFLKKSDRHKIPLNPLDNNTLYIRNKIVNNNDACPKTILSVSPSEYKTYDNSNVNMNMDSKCIDFVESFAMNEDVISGIKNRDATINNGLSKVNYTLIEDEVKNNAENHRKYIVNKTKYTNFIDLDGNYNGSIDYRETMTNMNMNTINEMLSDSDLINVQQKYQNIFWSILAIGTFVFTIANLKK